MKKLILTAVAMFMVSFDAHANMLSRHVVIINDGVILTRLTVPNTTKIDISSEQITVSKDKTKYQYKGAANMVLSFETGSVVVIKAEEIDIE